jgi:hypothetical protein
MIAAFIVWLIGLFLVPKVVKPFEAGYGIVTIGALIIWTILIIAFTLQFCCKGQFVITI